jgi:uncharacterized protein YcbX
MMGEELATAQVAEHRLSGDRVYGLLDRSDGKVATAKNPRKWPTLFAFRATFIEPSASSSVVEPVGTEPGFVENSWTGRTLAIGDDVRLTITGPCGRCVMTTLAQGDLPKDSDILRAAVQHNRAHVGVYASVVRGGTIRRGDPVRLSAV